MDKLKEKLHIGTTKAKHEEAQSMGGSNLGHNLQVPQEPEPRGSYDSELEGMTPEERVAYLKEFDHAEKNGEPKKGSFLEKLIARGNDRTEQQLRSEAEMREREKLARDAGAGKPI